MKWVLLALLELLQINCSPFFSSAFVCIMESKADLEAKIALYTQQLGQVDELLQIDATNPEFLKLKEDLVSLITLTKALLIQTIEATNNAQHSSSAVETKPPTSCSSSGTSAPSAVALRTGPIQVGEVVEVSGGERPFAGVVTAIVTETEYKIKYYEYPDEVSLPLTALHRLPLTAFTPEQIHIGLVCQCKYALDQKYYDCKVTAFTSYGCMVQYTAYGNAEEVPLAYLKPATPVNKTAVPGTERVGKNNLKPGPDGLIAIPESLTILPTDTEKVTLCICCVYGEDLCDMWERISFCIIHCNIFHPVSHTIDP